MSAENKKPKPVQIELTDCKATPGKAPPPEVSAHDINQKCIAEAVRVAKLEPESVRLAVHRLGVFGHHLAPAAMGLSLCEKLIAPHSALRRPVTVSQICAMGQIELAAVCRKCLEVLNAA